MFITNLFPVCLITYVISAGTAAEWSPLTILLAVLLAAPGVGAVHTRKTRINEIIRGEEDDFGND